LSHCAETDSRYSARPRIGSGSNSKRRSRPAGALRTIPARSSTRRCLVIACLVSFESSASCVMEHGCPEQSVATSFSLVRSPRAANTRARALGLAKMRLWLLCDMGFNVLHLLRPSAYVPTIRFVANVGGQNLGFRFGESSQLPRSVLRSATIKLRKPQRLPRPACASRLAAPLVRLPAAKRLSRLAPLRTLSPTRFLFEPWFCRTSGPSAKRALAPVAGRAGLTTK